MYAIIKTGGKQYRVTEGQKLRVELLHADAGATVILDEVMLVGGEGEPKIGRPLVAGAKVTATVNRHARDKKVIIFKKRRRKGYHKKQGHRQFFTELTITDHGTQKRSRQHPERSRLQSQVPRRKAVRRRGRDRGQHPHSSVWYAVPRGEKRGDWSRLHLVLPHRGQGQVREDARRPHARGGLPQLGLSTRPRSTFAQGMVDLAASRFAARSTSPGVARMGATGDAEAA